MRERENQINKWGEKGALLKQREKGGLRKCGGRLKKFYVWSGEQKKGVYATFGSATQMGTFIFYAVLLKVAKAITVVSVACHCRKRFC